MLLTLKYLRSKNSLIIVNDIDNISYCIGHCQAKNSQLHLLTFAMIFRCRLFLKRGCLFLFFGLLPALQDSNPVAADGSTTLQGLSLQPLPLPRQVGLGGRSSSWHVEPTSLQGPCEERLDGPTPQSLVECCLVLGQLESGHRWTTKSGVRPRRPAANASVISMIGIGGADVE